MRHHTTHNFWPFFFFLYLQALSFSSPLVPQISNTFLSSLFCPPPHSSRGSMAEREHGRGWGRGGGGVLDGSKLTMPVLRCVLCCCCSTVFLNVLRRRRPLPRTAAPAMCRCSNRQKRCWCSTRTPTWRRCYSRPRTWRLESSSSLPGLQKPSFVDNGRWRLVTA